MYKFSRDVCNLHGFCGQLVIHEMAKNSTVHWYKHWLTSIGVQGTCEQVHLVLVTDDGKFQPLQPLR